MTETADTPLNELLRHRDWVHRLARALVVDPATADDVEQEVWLRAILAPPRIVGAARSWLGRVLRNVVRDRWRGDARRDRREEECRYPETVESAFDVVARAEAHRDVVDAVVALALPYRKVVLLHYFDGLSPRAIASREGVRPDTIRKRLRRARGELRAHLAERLGGGWSLALVPLGERGFALPSRELARQGGALMRTKSKQAVAVILASLLVLAVTAIGLLGIGDEPMPREQSAGHRADETTADRRRLGVARDEADTVASSAPAGAGGSTLETAIAGRGRDDGRSGAARSLGGDDAPATESLADSDSGKRFPIEGRLVDDASDEPVAGAEVVALPLNGEGRAHAASSDTSGTFRLAGVSRGSYRLEVGHPARLQGRPFGYRPHTVASVAAGTLDVTVRLTRGRMIAGRVLDAWGRPVRSRMGFLATARTEHGDVDLTRSRVFYFDVDGTFALSGLDEGVYDLTVRLVSGPGDEIDPAGAGTTLVEGVPAGTADLEVCLGRGDVIAGRLVDEHGDAVSVRKGWLTAVPQGTRSGAPGTVWIPFDLSGGFRSAPLAADTVFEVSAGGMPGYLGARIDEVRPGTRDLVVRLATARRIAGVVRLPSGEPAPAVTPVRAVVLGVVAPDAARGEVGVGHTGADGAFTIEGLADRRFQVVAGGGVGWVASAKSAADVAAGTEDLELEVVLGLTLSGRLVDAAGRGVRTPSLRALRDDLHEVPPSTRVTSEDGRFVIRSLHAGTYRIWAVVADRAVDCGVVTVPADDVVLTIPVD